MNNTIIYPTDFSKSSNNALLYAVNMAKAIKSKLIIIHSIELNEAIVSTGNQEIINKKLEHLEKQSKKQFLAMWNFACKRGVLVETYLVKGDIQKLLPKFILDRDPMLVVMGTTGASTLENKLMGSVTAKVLRNTSSPMLVVPEKEPWRGLKKITFAFNYEESDIANLNLLMKIADYYNGQINITHVLSKGKIDDSNELNRFLKFKSKVTKAATYSKLNFDLRYSDNVMEGINSALLESESDLLAIVTRKRNIIERLLEKGVAQEVLYHSQTPIIIF